MGSECVGCSSILCKEQWDGGSNTGRGDPTEGDPTEGDPVPHGTQRGIKRTVCFLLFFLGISQPGRAAFGKG